MAQLSSPRAAFLDAAKRRRTRWQAVSGLLCLALLVAGCGTREAGPVVPPPALAPAGPVSPDGVYDGTMGAVRGGPLCGSNDPIRIAVRQGRFRFELNQPQVPERPTRSFDVAIGPDGGFDTGGGPAFMRGTVAGGHMQGVIAGDACGFQFEADRNGTF